jgi:hypothetical protein
MTRFPLGSPRITRHPKRSISAEASSADTAGMGSPIAVAGVNEGYADGELCLKNIIEPLCVPQYSQVGKGIGGRK